MSNAFDVFIAQGSEEAVAVEWSDQKYRDEIKVEVDNGVLKIGFEKRGKILERMGWGIR